jgi:phosphohistidine phosphatase
MQILLIRHAQAEPVGAGLVRDDWERSLAPRGRSVASGVAGKLDELGMKIERAFSSPLMRAVQTAELVARGVGFAGPIESCPFLARPGRWNDELGGFLQEVSGSVGPVALFGHNPDLSDIVTTALGLHPGSFGMDAGTACLLEITATEPVRAKLRWHIDPTSLVVHDRI